MIFIDACLRKPTPRPPVWLMRQAGRYLPEYRAIRAEQTFLEMCYQPEVVKEVTLQPIRRFNMDAAIIFSDILLPLVPMGLQLRFAKGEGPVIDNPVRNGIDVAKLTMPDFPRDMPYLHDALALTREHLDPSKALIGFAGAPFTLACYAHQGHGGNFDSVRRFMFTERQAFDALLAHLAEATIAHLRLQVAAGAQAIQLFDSWGGLLSAYDYLHRILPHVKTVMDGVADLGVPRILFIKNASHLRDFMHMAGADVHGLDWTMALRESRKIFGPDIAVQGNLDPMVLFAPPAFVKRRTQTMITLNGDQPGFIANLGHGINKETPIESVSAFVDAVLEYRPEED